MTKVSTNGPMACYRGLRHGHRIPAASSKVPSNLIRKWIAQADNATTAIYIDAIGWEEREFAGEMWQSQEV